jgi:hypothetical protein
MNALLVAAATAVLLHITPTVVLVKRPDAVARLAPGAERFTARDVHLSDADAHRLHETVDWSPPEGVLTLYTGARGDAKVATFLFIRVDTPHGPVETAVGFDPSGVVRGVIVTKATVETRPWIQDALRAGLAERYAGLTADGTPGGAAAVRDHVGSLAVYMAEQVDKGVVRALAAYRLFGR